MTAVQIIEEIKRLPKEELTKVIAFAKQAGAHDPLSPEKLGELARRMVEAKDPADADGVEKEMVRGFYSDQL
jgi:hypothetical protein